MVVVACWATRRRKVAARMDHVYPQAGKLCGKLSKLLGTSLRVSQFDDQILTLDKPCLAQPLPKCFHTRWSRRGGGGP